MTQHLLRPSLYAYYKYEFLLAGMHAWLADKRITHLHFALTQHRTANAKKVVLIPTTVSQNSDIDILYWGRNSRSLPFFWLLWRRGRAIFFFLLTASMHTKQSILSHRMHMICIHPTLASMRTGQGTNSRSILNAWLATILKFSRCNALSMKPHFSNKISS